MSSSNIALEYVTCNHILRVSKFATLPHNRTPTWNLPPLSVASTSLTGDTAYLQCPSERLPSQQSRLKRVTKGQGMSCLSSRLPLGPFWTLLEEKGQLSRETRLRQEDPPAVQRVPGVLKDLPLT